MTAKSPEAFRTISEVSDHLGTPAHVLRFWESRFPQIKPVKRAGGRRYYRPADVALLEGIKRLLHDDGMTIRGVQKVLREQGVRFVAGMAPEAPVEEVALAVALHDMEPPPAPAAADPEEATVVVLAAAVARARGGVAAPPPQPEPVVDTPAAQASLFDAPPPLSPPVPDADDAGPTLASRLRAMPAPADADMARRMVPIRNRLATLRGKMGRAARPGLA
jgi:DNA-binding transcriptional MerR regulator